MASINPTMLNCANSPHVSGKTDNHVRLTITGISQTDGSTNQTTISYKITVEGTPYTYLKSLYISLGGKELYNHVKAGNILTSWKAGQIIKEGSITFDNNADGSLTLEAYIKQLFYYDYSASRWESSSYTQESRIDMVCSSIPRISDASLSADTISLGEELTINTNRKSSTLTHRVYYSIGSTGDTLLASGVEDSYTWTVPKSLANQIPNADNGAVVIKVVTYSANGNEIGAKLLNLKVTIPTTPEFQPKITNVSLQEMGNVPSSLGFFIQGVSKIKGNISASGAYSSSITSYSVNFNNERFSESSFTSQIITSVNPTLSVTVKDSRGRIATYTTTVTVLEYKSPSINSFKSYRNISDPSMIDITLNCTIYKLQNKNTKNITFYYKKTTGNENYNSVSIDVNNLNVVESENVVTYSGTVTVVTNADPDLSYYSYLKVVDLFKNVPSINSYINTSFRLINISKDRRAFAVGKLHEKKGHVEIGLPQTYYENIYREEGDYEGIVLSCPSILNGMINYDSSANSLNFSINGTTYGITIWASDERLKEKITPVKINYTDKIKSIEHIEFDYIDGKKKVNVGYSANQLKEIDENFVLEIGKDKMLQPNISVLVPAITKTMQELIERVEILEKRLEKYESNKC